MKQRNGMKYKPLPILLIVLFLFLCGCNKPTPTGVEFDSIDTSHDPVQTPPTSKEPIVIEMGKDVEKSRGRWCKET